MALLLTVKTEQDLDTSLNLHPSTILEHGIEDLGIEVGHHIRRIIISEDLKDHETKIHTTAGPMFLEGPRCLTKVIHPHSDVHESPTKISIEIQQLIMVTSIATGTQVNALGLVAAHRIGHHEIIAQGIA